jgi:hypothetical protein
LGWSGGSCLRDCTLGGGGEEHIRPDWPGGVPVMAAGCWSASLCSFCRCPSSTGWVSLHILICSAAVRLGLHHRRRPLRLALVSASYNRGLYPCCSHPPPVHHVHTLLFTVLCRQEAPATGYCNPFTGPQGYGRYLVIKPRPRLDDAPLRPRPARPPARPAARPPAPGRVAAGEHPAAARVGWDAEGQAVGLRTDCGGWVGGWVDR